MTISITDTYQVLESTGTKDPYHFKIQVINKEDIKVIIIQTEVVNKHLVYNQDYTVQINSFDKSGYIHFIHNHPKKGEKIIIKRESNITQEVTFPPNVNFNEQNIELMGDKIVMQTQEIASEAKRALKFPMDLDDKDIELPYPKAGKTLMWSKNGTKLINSVISADCEYERPVPNPGEGRAGDLLRINHRKTDYELFHLGIKEPHYAEPNQILRASEDAYEFSDLPLFPENSDDNIGKVPVLKSKNEFKYTYVPTLPENLNDNIGKIPVVSSKNGFKYVKIDDKELVATLEFEKVINPGYENGLRIVHSPYDSSFQFYVGTKYILNFTYNKLNLNIEVSLYIKTEESIMGKDQNLTVFSVSVDRLPDKYQEFQTEFEFTQNTKSIKKKIKGNDMKNLYFPGFFLKKLLKVEAKIYKPLL